MYRTQKKDTFVSPLSLPGPHGYPVRFRVRAAGWKGFKIYGDDPKLPFRYIEWHARRQILHEGAHKRDKTPALVTVSLNWPAQSEFPDDDDAAALTITVHEEKDKGKNTAEALIPSSISRGSTLQLPASGPPTIGLLAIEPPNVEPPTPSPAEQTVPLEHTRCRPVTFQFTLPIATTTATGITTTLETFEWRRAARACRETRGIRKKTLPAMESGDERPAEEKVVYDPSGSVLVRLDGGPRFPAGHDTPLGFTPKGEEIVASYADSRDRKAWCYFQFWGGGATGELGEAFTHVAVMSGLAVWQDEGQERARKATWRAEVSHGIAPDVGSTPKRRGDWPGARKAR